MSSDLLQILIRNKLLQSLYTYYKNKLNKLNIQYDDFFTKGLQALLFSGLCLFSKELITSFSLLLCLVSSGGEGIDIGLITAHFQQKSEQKNK